MIYVKDRYGVSNLIYRTHTILYKLSESIYTLNNTGDIQYTTFKGKLDKVINDSMIKGYSASIVEYPIDIMDYDPVSYITVNNSLEYNVILMFLVGGNKSNITDRPLEYTLRLESYSYNDIIH